MVGLKKFPVSRKACDCGRGAILLSVARGKVAEGINLSGHYGRCVVLAGAPFLYTKSKPLIARLNYLRSEYKIMEKDYLIFDAMRQVAQCAGRAIRQKSDYSILIMADKRYNKEVMRDKLPNWIKRFIRTDNINISTASAMISARRFLREINQNILLD